MGGRLGRKFHPLYMSTDNLVKLTIIDAYTEADVDDGAVTMTLKDEDDVNITGAVSISLTAAGSDGIWYGYIPDTITVIEDDIYHLEISIISDSLTLLDTRWYKAMKYPQDEHDLDL